MVIRRASASIVRYPAPRSIFRFRDQFVEGDPAACIGRRPRSRPIRSSARRFAGQSPVVGSKLIRKSLQPFQRWRRVHHLMRYPLKCTLYARAGAAMFPAGHGTVTATHLVRAHIIRSIRSTRVQTPMPPVRGGRLLDCAPRVHRHSLAPMYSCSLSQRLAQQSDRCTVSIEVGTQGDHDRCQAAGLGPRPSGSRYRPGVRFRLGRG